MKGKGQACQGKQTGLGRTGQVDCFRGGGERAVHLLRQREGGENTQDMEGWSLSRKMNLKGRKTGMGRVTSDGRGNLNKNKET